MHLKVSEALFLFCMALCWVCYVVAHIFLSYLALCYLDWGRDASRVFFFFFSSSWFSWLVAACDSDTTWTVCLTFWYTPLGTHVLPKVQMVA